MQNLNSSVRGLLNPSYQESIAYLKTFPKFGADLGLLRMQHLLDQLPAIEAGQVIKVTGSNGKGSTVAMVSAILACLELDHGAYTSPHLICFNERIRVNGLAISDAELASAIAGVKEMAQHHLDASPADTFGGFEIFTALALHHFCEQKLPYLVLEAGIGGRYDSLRPVPGKLVALTSLDLEHTQLLGNSLTQIAYDKMDMCPDGGTLVLNRLRPDAPLAQIRGYASMRKLRLIEVEQECTVTDVTHSPEYTQFSLALRNHLYKDLRLSLAGAHQVDNAQLAILLVDEFLKQQGRVLSGDVFEAAVRQALAGVCCAARAQKVHEDPPVFVDVGHTPEAVKAFLATLPSLLGPMPVLLVTGVSHDKEVHAIIAQLLGIAAEVICTRAHHKGAAPDVIAGVVHKVAADMPVTLAPTVTEAVALALARASQQKMAVVVAGGLFLAAEFMLVLEGADPQNLWFF